MDRIVNTPYKKIIPFRYTKRFNSILGGGGGKPFGLWYSLGYGWHEFVEEGLPSRGIHEYDLHIKVDMKRLLVIDTFEKAMAFHNEYLGPSGIDGIREIKWNRVMRKYGGIEIKYPREFKWMFFKDKRFGVETLYMDTWDIPSGCIWDVSLVEYWDVKKAKGAGYVKGSD